MAEHRPRLPAHLGEDPAEAVRQDRQRCGPDERAPEPAIARKLAASSEPDSEKRQRRCDAAQADHVAEAPIGNRDIRHVVAGPEPLRILGLQVVEALDFRVNVAVGEVGQQIGHPHGEDFPLRVSGSDGEERKRRVRLRIPEGFGRGHLHRLNFRHHLALHIAGDRRADARRDCHEQAEPQRSAHHLDVLFSRQVPRRDPDDDGRARQQCADKNVRIRHHGNRIGQHCPDVGEFRSARFRVDGEADGILHPRVSRENEVRGQVRTDGYTPNARQVNTFR